MDTNFDLNEMRQHSDADLEESTEFSSTRAPWRSFEFSESLAGFCDQFSSSSPRSEAGLDDALVDILDESCDGM